MVDKICINCLVSGKVQGVWFRANTQKEAQKLGVTGWVRNLPDGRVEVLAEDSLRVGSERIGLGIAATGEGYFRAKLIDLRCRERALTERLLDSSRQSSEGSLGGLTVAGGERGARENERKLDLVIE